MNFKSEFSSQRSKLLLENFRKSIAMQSYISAKKAFHEAVEAPAPRFWVGEARATRVVALMKKGYDPTEGMTDQKKEMYREIYKRVISLEKENPGMALGDLVFMVVNNPAPKSYMSWERAKQLINREKRNRKLNRHSS